MSDLVCKRNGECANVRADVDDCTANWHMLQYGGSLKMTPFTVQRQEQTEVPEGKSSASFTSFKMDNVAECAGNGQINRMIKLIAVARDSESSVSWKRLLQLGQTRPLVDLQSRKSSHSMFERADTNHVAPEDTPGSRTQGANTQTSPS